MASPSIVWFRRDLRLGDNPALREACDVAGNAGVMALFVLDPALWRPAGPSRRSYLLHSLRDLDGSLRARGGGLTVVRGDPVDQVAVVAREVGAGSVHVAADFGPYGSRRDELVHSALADQGVELRRLGSPYAVAPGRVLSAEGAPYQVFTPFYRAWQAHGWRPPVDPPAPEQHWLAGPAFDLPEVDPTEGLSLPTAGEAAAASRWQRFLHERVTGYDEARNLPAEPGTSMLSMSLKWGEIHPRTLLADLAGTSGEGAATYQRELAWREFYADVLWRRPDTARSYLRPEFAAMEYDEPGQRFEAWAEGRTGYPIVDAGMRQMRAAGWMHNRVRMIVASFLVKDLHVEWQHGARHFMRWLVDADLASNQHNWQWVAGSGTDPAPYFRIFNPTTQGEKFDPDGSYVRRWVPELREVPTKHVHQPWTDPAGLPKGYPPPMLDHATERREALARLERIKSR